MLSEAVEVSKTPGVRPNSYEVVKAMNPPVMVANRLAWYCEVMKENILTHKLM